MNLEALIEIRGDSINSGHRWSEKRKLSKLVGTSKKETDIPETARTSIIWHSVMTMIISESSICHIVRVGPTTRPILCFVPCSGY